MAASEHKNLYQTLTLKSSSNPYVFKKAITVCASGMHKKCDLAVQQISGDKTAGH